jgi:hypothetical protein
MRAAGVVHVGLGPLPEPIEFLAMVQLHGDHQAVGHAFGAHVAVAGVGDIGLVATDGIVNALGVVVAMEELPPGGVQFGAHLGFRLAEEFAKKIARRGRGPEAGREPQQENETE